MEIPPSHSPRPLQRGPRALSGIREPVRLGNDAHQALRNLRAARLLRGALGRDQDVHVVQQRLRTPRCRERPVDQEVAGERQTRWACVWTGPVEAQGGVDRALQVLWSVDPRL